MFIGSGFLAASVRRLRSEGRVELEAGVRHRRHGRHHDRRSETKVRKVIALKHFVMLFRQLPVKSVLPITLLRNAMLYWNKRVSIVHSIALSVPASF